MCVCVCVCVCVCLLSHISPLEHLFVLKILSRTQRATEVKKIVGFSLKPLHCGDPALPPLKAICTVGHFPAESTHAHYTCSSIYHAVLPRVLHFSAFILDLLGKTLIKTYMCITHIYFSFSVAALNNITTDYAVGFGYFGEKRAVPYALSSDSPNAYHKTIPAG